MLDFLRDLPRFVFELLAGLFEAIDFGAVLALLLVTGVVVAPFLLFVYFLLELGARTSSFGV